jgi:hypothetical protein
MTEINLMNRKQVEDTFHLPAGLLADLARRHQGPAFYRLTSRTVMYSRDEIARWRDATLVTAQGNAKNGL